MRAQVSPSSPMVQVCASRPCGEVSWGPQDAVWRPDPASFGRLSKTLESLDSGLPSLMAVVTSTGTAGKTGPAVAPVRGSIAATATTVARAAIRSFGARIMHRT
ncbi:hypothetical protein ABZ461_10085 [Actinacidiphila glaucinigra]|uniref:hypothetical protein n=1 Tax=Actinacidiphila glaucinigra TaxID=235986 RepID=UPI0033E25150